MRGRVSRRRLLAVIGAAGIFLAAGWRTRGLAAVPDAEVARLVGLFKHRGSARAIGRVYLAARPEEADARRLVDLIGRADDDPPLLDAANDTELRAWIRQRQARDFATGRIVKLDGWLLSATEVRICALAALT